MKKLFALLLTLLMALSPLTVLAEAPSEETALPETVIAAEEPAQETEPVSYDIPEATAEEPAGEDPEEDPAAEPAEAPEEVPAEEPAEEAGEASEEAPIPSEQTAEAEYPWSGMDDAGFAAFLQAEENADFLRAVLADAGSEAYAALLARVAAIADEMLKQTARAALAVLTAPAKETSVETDPAEEVQAEEPVEELPAEEPTEEAAAEELPEEVTAEDLFAENDELFEDEAAEDWTAAGNDIKAMYFQLSDSSGNPEFRFQLPSDAVLTGSTSGKWVYTSATNKLTLTIQRTSIVNGTPRTLYQGFTSSGYTGVSVKNVNGIAGILVEASASSVMLYICTKLETVSISLQSTQLNSSALKVYAGLLMEGMTVYQQPDCMGGRIRFKNGSQTQITIDMPYTLERIGGAESSTQEYRSADDTWRIVLYKESIYWTPERSYAALRYPRYISIPGTDCSEVAVFDPDSDKKCYYLAAKDISIAIKGYHSDDAEMSLMADVIKGISVLIPRSDYTVEIKKGSQVQAAVTVPRCFYQTNDNSFASPNGTTLTVETDSAYYTARESFDIRTGQGLNTSYTTVDGVTAVNSSFVSGTELGKMILDAPAKDISFFVTFTGTGWVVDGMEPIWHLILSGIRILQKPEAASSQLEAFVTRLYSICLDRAPGAAELSYYVNQLSAGTTTGVAVASNFVFSNEFKAKNLCNEHYVIYLYLVFFDRAPAPSEISYHVGRLTGGVKREEIFNGFALSNEYKALCQSYGITQGTGISVPSVGTVPTGACTVSGCSSVTEKLDAFIRRLYIDCLGRATVAASEVAYYRTQLQSKAITGTQIAWNFFSSPEFTDQNLSSSEYVTRLYKVLMGRSPAAAEVTYHVNRLNSGVSRRDIFNGFAMSAEFLNICNSYGIERGSAISA